MTGKLLLGVVVVSAATLLATGCGSSGSPRPDLIFVSSRDGDYALFGMNADGSRQKRLSHEQGDPSTSGGVLFQTEPAWSPDGREIAFASRRDGTATHLFVMRADGSGTRRLTDTKLDDSNPSWSPDGSKIVFDRGVPGDIYIMAADGTGAHRVIKDDAVEHDPAWSPDGRWIAYARKTPGTSIREIWLVHPDGSERHQLTHLGASSVAPAWSPDSMRLAFASDKPESRSDIYVIGANGKHQRPLTIVGENFEPSWSPDGKKVAFWNAGGIFVVDVDGGQEQLTNEKGNDSSPVWRPPVR